MYACDCARSTFERYEAERGRPFRGIGCPGNCRSRHLAEDGDVGLRVAIGAGLRIDRLVRTGGRALGAAAISWALILALGAGVAWVVAG